MIKIDAWTLSQPDFKGSKKVVTIMSSWNGKFKESEYFSQIISQKP